MPTFRPLPASLVLLLLGAGCLSDTETPAAPPEDPPAAEGEGEGEGEGEPDPGPGRGFPHEEEEPPVSPCAEAELIDFLADAAEAEDGAWTLQGEVDSKSRLAGSCGGTGGEVALRFVAPEHGGWRFETLEDGTAFDPLLYARSTCDDESTELACNDDLMRWRQPMSRIDLVLEAGEAAYVVVDSYDPERGGTFVLSARRMAVVERDGACDPVGETDVCDRGDFCRAELTADWAPASDGVCTEATAPVLLEASAQAHGERLLLRVHGEDASRDVVGLRLELLTAAGPLPLGRRGQTYAVVGFDEPVYGQAEFSGFVELELPQAGAVSEARMSLLDSQELESERAEVEVTGLPQVPAGEPCDPKERDNACAGEAVCLAPATGDGEEPPAAGTCGLPSPPVLGAVEAFVNGTTNALGLRLAGEDPDGDVAAVRARLLDAEGRTIPYAPDGALPQPGQELGLKGALAGIEVVDTAWTATLSAILPRTLEGVAAVEVVVADAQELESEALRADVAPTPEVEPGAACDLQTALDACPAGQLCTEVPAEDDETTTTCVDPVPGCPDGWEVEDLVEHTLGSRYVFRGDTTGAPSHTSGSCGGGSGQQVFQFTSPRAERWAVWTETEERYADTVLYVRSQCRYEGPAVELACNDDADSELGLASSSLVVSLEEGEAVWIFVDGFVNPQGPWQGSYTLFVDRARD